MHVLRRLVPSRVALQLDQWKGAPSPDLLGPFEKAERAFEAQNYPEAEGGLDQLATRFAEPRWPSLKPPFSALRVTIPAPQPPHWDPEHGLSAAERETRRAQRTASDQLALLEGSIAWAAQHGVPVDDLAPAVERGRAQLTGADGVEAFYREIDPVWAALRDRIPKPRNPADRPAAAPAPGSSGEEV